jgi:DNA-binding NtrC family response regulator
MGTTADAALRVLIVDDELLIRWSLAEALVQAGHHVVQASDGAAALCALRQAREPLDVILLDLRLPDSDDLTLLTHIRRASPATSVVLMTTYGSPELRAGALRLGACRVLDKPFDISEVNDVVLRANRRRSN